MENSKIVSVGIFFDGTGNNGINANSSQKPPYNNESYYGSQTNIYKLFELFIGDEKAYIEGVGTITKAEDSSFAMATCKNPVGYVGYSSDDKLAKAFAFIDAKMKDKSKEYHFYIYGFSRGAMLARTFSYELLNGSKIAKNIRVKFLGVFDTVESTPFNHYNITVVHGVEKAFHLCAVNECRYFFPLTGIFEDSRHMKDTKSDTGKSVWKEIFVPGAHADVGGGYLEGSQSVYISPNYIIAKDLEAYVLNVRNTKKDAQGNKIWDHLLKDSKIDVGNYFSQAYVARSLVYNDLSKIYGKLMVTETNAQTPIFNTNFNESNFEFDAQKHPYLVQLSNELEVYSKDLPPNLKPAYDYGKLADYTHISANFGLYTKDLLQKTDNEINVEEINNGLNVPSHSSINKINPVLTSDIHLLEDGSVTDYAYGSNIPNNDIWSRSILIK